MSRRADPERIYQAQRAGTFRRLTLEGRLDELDAEHWVSAWERHAETLGLDRLTGAYWDAGWEWIKEQRFPNTSMSAEADDGVYGG